MPETNCINFMSAVRGDTDSSLFLKMFHVCQEDMMPAPVLHHQTISNTHIYTGIRQSQSIHGKFICIQFVGTGRSNLWSGFSLHETQIVAAPTTEAVFADRCHDRLHFLDPTYP